MRSGHAPVSGRELHAFLTAEGIVIRSRRGGRGVIAVIGSTEVGIPAASKKETADLNCLHRVAGALGITTAQLALRLGRSSKRAGKAKADPTDKTQGRAEAKKAASDLKHKLASIERWLDRGAHGRSVYGRTCNELAAALGLLQHLPPHGDGDGYVTPDDSGYKPTQYDAVTTGTARATGDTARAVRRGKTFTAYELNGDAS